LHTLDPDAPGFVDPDTYELVCWNKAIWLKGFCGPCLFGDFSRETFDMVGLESWDVLLWNCVQTIS
jgi:hypothetical protein